MGTAENGRLRLFKVRQRENALRRFLPAAGFCILGGLLRQPTTRMPRQF
jgi:hypothetical protein